MPITLRATKGTELTHAELDANFSELVAAIAAVESVPGAPGAPGPAGPTGTLLGVATVVVTTRTLTAADNGFVLYFTAATAVTLTTAAGLGAAFSCMVVQAGAGQITVAPGAGTTLLSYGNMLKSAGQHAALTLVTPSADTFVLAGQTA